MPLKASIVMPTFNKRRFLELTLTSFFNQIYPVNKYEVILIDDGSTDDTDDFLAQLNPPFTLRKITQENKGRSAARNTGILAAEGEIIIFCDDDMIVEPTFIEEHLKCHEEPNYAVAGLRREIVSFIPESFEYETANLELKDIPLLQVISKEYILNNFEKIRENATELGDITMAEKTAIELFGSSLDGLMVPWVFFVAANVSISKRNLEEVGLFDEEFVGWGVEDWELGYRLHRHGIKYRYNENACNYHQQHLKKTSESFKESAQNYLRFCRKHPYAEIYLLWKFAYQKMDIQEYNSSVAEFYNLSESRQKDYLLQISQECKENMQAFLSA
ncbi:TPA: glycosyltransferase [Candidatus Bathyarchaeota archaeon]|nr:glycosyltransferase [Candidatus Bathyarchaeota archaeon]